MTNWFDQKFHLDRLMVRVYFEFSTGRIEDISGVRICINEKVVAPVNDIGIQIPIDANKFSISYYPYIKPSGGGDSEWSANTDFPCGTQENSPDDASWRIFPDGKLAFLTDGHGILSLQSPLDPALHKAAQPYMLSRQTFYYYYKDEEGNIEYKNIPKHPVILIKRWVAPKGGLFGKCYDDWVTMIVDSKLLDAGKRIRTICF
jgi:hypothetical protein